MSGAFAVTPFAMSLRSVVLPAFGGETISPRCPRPDGREQVDEPRRQRHLGRLQADLLGWEDGCQLLEVRPATGPVRLDLVDLLYPGPGRNTSLPPWAV